MSKNNQRTTNFSDKIKNQVDDHKAQGSKGYGYLKLPKNIQVYSIDIPKTKEFVKPKFDVIPYIVNDAKHIDTKSGAEIGEPWWRKPFRIHKHIGVDDDSVICLSTIGKRCPICEYQKELIANKASKADIKALNYSKRSIYLIWPKEDKDVDDEIHILDISDFCFYDTLMIDAEEMKQWNFPSLSDGKTLSVRFDKAYFDGNEFPKAIRVSFLDRDEQYEESILEEVPCLDEILNILSYDELNAKFLAISDEETTETKGKVKDEEDKPRSKKSTYAKIKEKEEPEITWTQIDSKSNRSLCSLIIAENIDLNPDKFDDDNELKIAIAEKLGIKVPAAKPKKEEEETEKVTWESLTKLEGRRLSRVVKMNNLDITISDFEDDDPGLREAIAKEMDIEIPKLKKATGSKKETSKQSSKENQCPSGFVYGKDNDKYNECEECTVWKACLTENEKLKGK
jgi:hypothetical protein